LGNEAFLILRGSVRILPNGEDGTPLVPEDGNFNRMGEGDLLFSRGSLLGELSLLDDGIRSSTIIPYSKEVDVLVWSKKTFMEQLRMGRSRALRICRLLGERLRGQIEKESVSSKPQLRDIARVLYDASNEGGKTVDVIWLARQCGFWPEDINEITKKWQAENTITFDENNIKVSAPELLFDDTLRQG
jgi:CRP-like cAMP-binding protein